MPKIFQWGLPAAMWMECCQSKVVEETDRLCPKRGQGLSVGQYLAVAAINRAIAPKKQTLYVGVVVANRIAASYSTGVSSSALVTAILGPHGQDRWGYRLVYLEGNS